MLSFRRKRISSQQMLLHILEDSQVNNLQFWQLTHKLNLLYARLL